MKKNFTCIIIDLPGFGKSSNLTFESIPRVTEQVQELLHHETATETILLGHSLGGYIVADYMSRYADQLRGVAFIHSTALADAPSKTTNRQKTIDFITKHGTKEFFKLFIPGLVATQNVTMIPEQLQKTVHNTPTLSIINGLQAMKDRPSHLSTLRIFEKPILFLMGKDDHYYDIRDIYTQAAVCSLAQISQIDNVGHLSMIEDSASCYDEVSKFIRFAAATSN